MERPFREHHLLQLLNDWDSQLGPIDRFIATYFRAHHALGSKDRQFIADTIYTMIRWQGLLDHLCGSSSWSDRYKTLITVDWDQVLNDLSIPDPIRVSCPNDFFNLLESAYGKEKALELSQANNEPAPTVVRTNLLKISRDQLLARWQDKFEVQPTQHSPAGIVFKNKINFWVLPEFQEGLFEVQDEGSQMVAFQVKAKPGQLIMDFCSGSGGKTLAFAPWMERSGQIYLHDIRPQTLKEARTRLKRAGIQNAQTILSGSPSLKRLKKKMDWVLVDAPCSGSGTLRRNPDMKWRLNEALVQRIRGEQRTIFEQALSFIKPGGKIIYATCSILPEENERQVNHFTKTYSLKLTEEPFQSFPKKGEMDGFFAATLTQK